MASPTKPVFNVTANAWLTPNVPGGSPPDYTLSVQIYIASRGLIDCQPGTPLFWVPPVYVRFDDAGSPLGPGVWIWEIPSLSGRFYRVRWKEVVHLGFPNEYKIHVVEQCDTGGTAILRDVP